MTNSALIGPAALAISGVVTWSVLADVGQAYSGVLAALALVGVVASVVLQVGQIKRMHEQTRLMQVFGLRQRTFELIKLGMERDDLLEVAAESVEGVSPERAAYANLWVSTWVTYWDLKLMSETALRKVAGDMFRNDDALAWWNATAGTWTIDPDDRRKMFMAIMTDEARKATAARPRIPRQRRSNERVQSPISSATPME